MEQYDLVIIGAGWHGLAMARTYKHIFPSSSMLVVDMATSVGGVWAEDRLYPGLRTNNVIGSYEFSDFPLVPEKYGLELRTHIPGDAVHQYLRDFVDYFQLQSCLRLGITVESAELLKDGTWVVALTPTSTTSQSSSIRSKNVVAKRLVLATGLTSQPFIPTYKGMNSFKGSILHSKQLREQSQALSNAKHVVVIGGNKSAFDVCYGAAKTAHEVHMIMRPTGGGPSWVWPASLFGRFRTSLARISCTRLPACFDPCIWAGHDGSGRFRDFLHRTWIGRMFVWIFWNFLGWVAQRTHRLNTHAESRRFAPWTSPYWMGNSLSIHNYDTSWFELAQQGKIKAHITDVAYLDNDTVHLTDGTRLKANILVCCTGWKAIPGIRFIPEGIVSQLGLPHSNASSSTKQAEARERVLAMRPDLRRPPRRCCSEPESTGYRLYRFTVPAHPRFLTTQRTIGFVGAHLSVHAVVLAQAQALWLTAFFADAIPSLDRATLTAQTLAGIEAETVLVAQYEALRHPREAGGLGSRYPDLVFDSLAFVDVLLSDLGLRVMRKIGRGAWLREWIEPYSRAEYRGLIEEWRALQREKQGKIVRTEKVREVETRDRHL